MVYEEHFPVYLDYNDYEYFRVSRENIEEFNNLKKTLLKAAKDKKLVKVQDLNGFFELLKLVSSEACIKNPLKSVQSVSSVCYCITPVPLPKKLVNCSIFATFS